MIHRWKASSQRRIQIVTYGVYSSIPRALVGLSTLWRYRTHFLRPDLALILGQMFTEFVAECRAGRLKARLTETSADVSAMPQKMEALTAVSA